VDEFCLAVDIGGTKLAAGLVSRSGTLTGAAHVPTAVEPSTTAEELFARLAELIDGIRTTAAGRALRVCGVGCGGPMDPGGVAVSPLNIAPWRGFPLRDRLAELTGLPTGVDNDAKALALGEHWRGAARGQDDFIAIVVSTGVGGGIVLDGRLLDGRLGNAGHIGHVVVEPDGRRCSCGGYGCLEAEASGRAIAEMTGGLPTDAPSEVVERTGTLVGRAVASVASLLDLPLAVVAGSVALGFGGPFFAAAQAELSYRARLDFSRDATIVAAGLGAEGPLVGAGAVGWRLVDGEAPGARP
jgi:glucokinase